MGDLTHDDITNLLNAWQQGDADAFKELETWAYPQLKRLASSYLRSERKGYTLQTTELAHEAYIALIGVEEPFKGRESFLALIACLMRHLLIDRARAAKAQKRGGGQEVYSLREVDVAEERPIDLIELDDALKDLAVFAPRQSRILELRYFVGLTQAEIGTVLKISKTLVQGENRAARAWLRGRLSGGGDGGS